MTDFAHRKPDIAYPCRWEYKLIGASQRRMRQAVGQIVTELDYTLSSSHNSRTGKYCSLRLEVTVPDEATRVGLFHELRHHEDIIMVL